MTQDNKSFDIPAWIAKYHSKNLQTKEATAINWLLDRVKANSEDATKWYRVSVEKESELTTLRSELDKAKEREEVTRKLGIELLYWARLSATCSLDGEDVENMNECMERADKSLNK